MRSQLESKLCQNPETRSTLSARGFWSRWGTDLGLPELILDLADAHLVQLQPVVLLHQAAVLRLQPAVLGLQTSVLLRHTPVLLLQAGLVFLVIGQKSGETRAHQRWTRQVMRPDEKCTGSSGAEETQQATATSSKTSNVLFMSDGFVQLKTPSFVTALRASGFPFDRCVRYAPKVPLATWPFVIQMWEAKKKGPSPLRNNKERR